MVVGADSDFSEVVEEFKSSVGEDGGVVEVAGRFCGGMLKRGAGRSEEANPFEGAVLNALIEMVFALFDDSKEGHEVFPMVADGDGSLVFGPTDLDGGFADDGCGANTENIEGLVLGLNPEADSRVGSVLEKVVLAENATGIVVVLESESPESVMENTRIPDSELFFGQ